MCFASFGACSLAGLWALRWPCEEARVGPLEDGRPQGTKYWSIIAEGPQTNQAANHQTWEWDDHGLSDPKLKNFPDNLQTMKKY